MHRLIAALRQGNWYAVFIAACIRRFGGSHLALLE
jgi:hypothetical protein